MAKLVYAFTAGKADGGTKLKDLLGGKGANLSRMTHLGIPVPPGFTISTQACNLFLERRGRMPETLEAQVERALHTLEKIRAQRFGDPNDPMLVSVRSGAKFSMPGMMDTILNLGLSERGVEGLARASGDRRFAFDSYRRFVQMYAGVVLEIPKREFEDRLTQLKQRRGVRLDTELAADDLAELAAEFKRVVLEATGKPFPDRAEVQLWGAIGAVFRSWNNSRARRYRRQYGIPDNLGTAVNVQCMVFGNLGEDCATGVAFTRDPATGANELYGEYLVNAQGEDVVAGIRTPQPLRRSKEGPNQVSLERAMPAVYKELERVRARLERHYRDMQDLEFTVERGKLFLLQTRTGKRTGLAGVNIAFDLHREKRISKRDVIQRIEPEMLVQLLAPIFAPDDVDRARREGRVLARGLPAGPGAACGLAAFTPESAEEMNQRGQRVVLVRTETSPEDIGGMLAATGILTSRGGMTSHAAVVARGMGKPCIVGAEALHVDEEAHQIRVGEKTIMEGEEISLDGTTGEVFVGRLNPHASEIQQVLIERSLTPGCSAIFRRFAKLMRWSDEFRTIGVRTNADTPHDAAVARAFGAEGIGLCRTEHMFFGEDRIALMRQMILAPDHESRDRALAGLLPLQRADFVGIFEAMRGLPVTIRLLDPPLHEFLPTTEDQFEKLASALGVSWRRVAERAEELREANPMLGHRGCRLGITFPEIYDMQVRAILEAAADCTARKIRVRPEIMVPLVGSVEELQAVSLRIEAVAAEIQQKGGRKIQRLVGTMIEVPRACLVAGEIAEHADFFSFGTNDLTQMTFGFSRDDVAKFLPTYLERGLLRVDPFSRVDAPGVGRLIRLAIEEGRAARPDLKIGVCGEHGGDPQSVAFFHAAGVDYVSCSPFRVPVARLAAARAARGAGTGSGTA